MSDWKRPTTGETRVSDSSGGRAIRGGMDARRYQIAVAASVFNDTIVDALLAGAAAAWQKHGGHAEKLVIVRVPGAFELPVVARKLAATGRFHAIVALGCVIRGDTPHFEYVAGECARGLQHVSCDTGVPVVFGVLTVNTFEQARVRASVTEMNKGGESMEVALEMADLLAQIK